MNDIAPFHTLGRAGDVWLENLKGRDHSEDLGVDGKIMLEWILITYDGKV
jgi:hypothetical protein